MFEVVTEVSEAEPLSALKQAQTVAMMTSPTLEPRPRHHEQLAGMGPVQTAAADLASQATVWAVQLAHQQMISVVASCQCHLAVEELLGSVVYSASNLAKFRSNQKAELTPVKSWWMLGVKERGILGNLGRIHLWVRLIKGG